MKDPRNVILVRKRFPQYVDKDPGCFALQRNPTCISGGRERKRERESAQKKDGNEVIRLANGQVLHLDVRDDIRENDEDLK